MEQKTLSYSTGFVVHAGRCAAPIRLQPAATAAHIVLPERRDSGA
jgi:hypothetical protein